MTNLKKLYNLLLLLVLILPFVFAPKNEAKAGRGSGPERIKECNSEGVLEDFAPISPPSGGFYKNMEFDLSNSTCLGAVLTAYISTKAAIKTVDAVCNRSYAPPSPFPTPLADAFVLIRGAHKAITDQNCQKSFAAFVGAFQISSIVWMSIFVAAVDNYKNVRVCGSDWYAPNPETYKNDKIGPYQQYVIDQIALKVSSTYDNDKIYRENFHKGKEFNDNVSGEEKCIDPATNEPQRYYFRGLQQADFLCEKYNPEGKANAENYKKAYKCCLNRRQNYICLERGGTNEIPDNEIPENEIPNHKITDHIFCRAGQKCSFQKNPAVIFEAYRRENNRLICAKSHSLCPFNFSVGGGSVYPDFYKDGAIGSDGKFRPFSGFPGEDDEPATRAKACENRSEVRNNDCSLNNKSGKLKNYCQYYTHCTISSPISFHLDFNYLSPYFSRACIDSIGDSRNTQSSNSFDPGIGLGSQNNFSAPILQCLKETMENIFNNTAGHTRCVDGSLGDLNNICPQNSYKNISYDGRMIWKKGSKVKENSLFETLQKRLKNVITLLLVLAVTFLGAKILILKVDITNKKEILTFIVKIALVIYFVNGSAWKDIFFDGIYKGSSEISRIFFKINSVEYKNSIEASPSYKCNFGSLYGSDGMKISTSKTYPAGKEYLLIWDTLDCKIMQYLNYGPTLGSGTIFALIIASLFTGGIGLTLALSVFILAFSLIATVIRAMHIFIASSIAIIVYVFVSPIIIPLILFEKTKGIFDSWLTNLVSFTLQPIILFSFLAIFISLSEAILFKNAIFSNGRMVCSPHCRDKDGKIITDLNTCKASSGGNQYTDIINPLEITPACILRIDEFKDNNGFAMLGITLPTVANLNNNKINIVLKCALFLYVLLQMIDQIPSITSGLTGESIDVKSMNGLQMLKKFTEGVRTIQKRVNRGARKNLIGSDKKDDNDDDDGKGSGSSGDSGSDKTNNSVLG